MDTYDESNTDTHFYCATVWTAYGDDVITHYSTARALLKEYARYGLTIIDIFKIRKGITKTIDLYDPNLPCVVDIQFLEYSNSSC